MPSNETWSTGNDRSAGTSLVTGASSGGAAVSPPPPSFDVCVFTDAQPTAQSKSNDAPASTRDGNDASMPRASCRAEAGASVRNFVAAAPGVP